MKTILALLLSAPLCWAVQFANVLTGELSDTLPKTIALPSGKVVTGAGLDQAALIGWRKVKSTATAAKGFTATSYTVVERDGKECDLTVKTSTNDAVEKAKADAAKAAFASNQLAQTAATVQSYMDIITKSEPMMKQWKEALDKLTK